MYCLTMKCEFCSWGSKPESLPEIKSHIEVHHYQQSFSVVWRGGEFYITKEANNGEKVFDVGVVFHDIPKTPEKYVPKQYLDTEGITVKKVNMSNSKQPKQVIDDSNI